MSARAQDLREWTLALAPTSSASSASDELVLDPATGLPALIVHHGRSVTLTSRVQATIGGGEQRAPLGGLAYPGAVAVSDVVALGPPERVVSAAVPEWTVAAQLGGWRIDWTYTWHDSGPHWGIVARLRPTPDAAPLRRLAFDVELELPEAASWLVNAPGNRIRRDVPLRLLHRPIGISTQTGLRGSPGLLACTDPAGESTAFVWATTTEALGYLSVAPTDAGLRARLYTAAAAAADESTDLRVSLVRVGLRPGDWAAHRTAVSGWYPAAGLTLPTDGPAWTRSATIFEAQIGYSVFGPDEWRYAPYPEPADLLADLPRIRQLGFDTLQLMPRQPYPSYNVHDYADISTSYGEEATVAELVRAAHDIGMRVILDVIMHGVLDRESIDEALAGVRTGPYADRIGEATPEVSSLDMLDDDARAVAWSRHIVDFAPYWRAGAPERHRLCDERPEWFCTDSAGRITGVYTKAFDLARPEWREYFTVSMVELVRRLDVDGFRFDAPTYNDFASWSPAARSRAGEPAVGAIGLFATLRRRLHATKPELMMYTEPSGPMLRRSMDVNYNYDEQWLIPAIMQQSVDAEPWLVADGADLRQWFADRDATLPDGAVTAHHIDSHDTFWWPLPGAKWRREQYGVPATRAWLAVFALCGGPFMSFVGAELGVEDLLIRINRLRSTHPAVRDGAGDFQRIGVDQRCVFSVVRRPAAAPPALVLVNLADHPVRVQALAADFPAGRLVDVLADGARREAHAVPVDDHDDHVEIRMNLDRYEACVLAPQSEV